MPTVRIKLKFGNCTEYPYKDVADSWAGAIIYLTRVPCVGENVRLTGGALGFPFKVTHVEHWMISEEAMMDHDAFIVLGPTG